MCVYVCDNKFGKMENKVVEYEDGDEVRKQRSGVVRMRAWYVKDLYWKDFADSPVGWDLYGHILPNQIRDLVHFIKCMWYAIVYLDE